MLPERRLLQVNSNSATRSWFIAGINATWERVRGRPGMHYYRLGSYNRVGGYFLTVLRIQRLYSRAGIFRIGS